jgi:hypothetical protein
LNHLSPTVPVFRGSSGVLPRSGLGPLTFSVRPRVEQRFGSLLVRKLLEIGGARVMGHGRGEGGSDECDGRGRRWMEQVKRGREGTGQD